jgi:hypothetical protein
MGFGIGWGLSQSQSLMGTELCLSVLSFVLFFFFFSGGIGL